MSDHDDNTIGGLIRLHRIANEMTQKDLARKSGLTEPTIWRYENGRMTPTIETLGQVAQALGCQFSDLIPMKEVLA